MIHNIGQEQYGKCMQPFSQVKVTKSLSCKIKGNPSLFPVAVKQCKHATLQYVSSGYLWETTQYNKTKSQSLIPIEQQREPI